MKYKHYSQARKELIHRLGEYCSYCEMHLDASLAVEHVKPKKPRGMAEVDRRRALDWDNFLLSCANCNSVKGAGDIDLDDYVWPDRDNTYRAFQYSEGGLVAAAESLDGRLQRNALNMINLVGLNKICGQVKASDRRWLNRREAWDLAVRAKERLVGNDCLELREQIAETAQAKGFWSVWMTVFKADGDMLQRLIEAYPGTCRDCFTIGKHYEPTARQGGKC
ncbi:MAG: HNH endonuclease [Pseudomonadota bacterium]